jgi:hypothetical protein
VFGFSFNLPPLRGKVARGISRVTEGGPSPHDKWHQPRRPAFHRIRDSKFSRRGFLATQTTVRVSHRAQFAGRMCGLARRVRPPVPPWGKRSRRSRAQAAPAGGIASRPTACAEASTTIGVRLPSCSAGVRGHGRSTWGAPFRPPREVRGVHLPPRGGKAKKIASPPLTNLFCMSQFIAIRFLRGEA